MTSGFVSMGMDVILTGPLPTPALSMLITSLRADMGVMITASHNTFEYNGLKFFDAMGNKLTKEMELMIEKIVLKQIIRMIRGWPDVKIYKNRKSSCR